MKTKSKTFVLALSIVGHDPMKAKNFLDDKRLTALEKAILKSILLLRDHQFDEIINLLKDQYSPDPFVESQRLLTLGATYNNMGDFKNAVDFYEASLRTDPTYRVAHKEFHTTYSLFILNQNLQNFEKIQYYYRRLKELSSNTDFEVISIMTAHYAILRLRNELKEAKEVIDELQNLVGKMTEYQVVNYFIDRFDIHLCLGMYFESAKDLLHMKSFRKFRSSTNYRFMKSLFDHFLTDAPLYVYSQDFASFPVLHDQIMVIKLLQEDNLDQAKSFWDKLRVNYPDVYGEPFTYHGLTSIFSLCLQKYLDKQKDKVIDLSGKSKEDALIEILTVAKSPVSIERVFQLIYGRESESKDDFVKLRSLIYKAKKKTGIEISFKKGCYKIS